MPPELANQDVIEDDRCDPAEDVLDDDDFRLVSVLEDLDVGTGPSDSVTCLFALVGRTPEEGEVVARSYEVTPSGAVHLEEETVKPSG